jgi:hypothetical protein
MNSYFTTILFSIFTFFFLANPSISEEYTTNLKKSSEVQPYKGVELEPIWGAQLKDVSLEWRPSESVTGMDPIDITVFRNKKIVVMPFNDFRSNPAEIGKNVEDRADRLVTTKDNVPKWLTDRFVQTLNEFNIKTVKDDGTIILEGDILKFYVTEKSTYKADVALKLRLKSTNGKILWENMIVGKSNKFGTSYKERNYHEGLSNACIDLVYNMLKNDQIVQIVKDIK